MTMHATSPFTNFKEIEGSIFNMKTFSVLTQNNGRSFKGSGRPEFYQKTSDRRSCINVNSPTAE